MLNVEKGMLFIYVENGSEIKLFILIKVDKLEYFLYGYDFYFR